MRVPAAVPASPEVERRLASRGLRRFAIVQAIAHRIAFERASKGCRFGTRETSQITVARR